MKLGERGKSKEVVPKGGVIDYIALSFSSLETYILEHLFMVILFLYVYVPLIDLVFSLKVLFPCKKNNKNNERRIKLIKIKFLLEFLFYFSTVLHRVGTFFYKSERISAYTI